MKDDDLLTTGDLGEVAGLSAKMIKDRVRAGVIVPVAGGRGPGDHARFTLMTAVGVMVAEYLRLTEGCNARRAARVVASFAALTPEELKAKARYYIVACAAVTGTGVSLTELLENDVHRQTIDVMALYVLATDRAKKIRNRLARKLRRGGRERGGRVRGLANI